MIKKRTITWTVGKKLYASFGVLLVLLMVMAGLSLIEMERMNRSTKEITEVWMKRSVTAAQISYQIERIIGLDKSLLMEREDAKLAALDAEVLEQMKATVADLGQYRETLRATKADDEQREMLDHLEEAVNAYGTIHQQFEQFGRTVNIVHGAGNRVSEVNTLLINADRAFTEMKTNVDELLKLGIDGGLAKADQAAQMTKGVRLTLSLSGVIAVLISLGLAGMITRNISQPVRAVSTALRKAAEGDLNQKGLTVKNKDELGELVNSLNAMIARTRSLMGDIQQTSFRVADNAKQILLSSEQASELSGTVNQAMQEITAGSLNQQTSSEESARAMEEMAGGVQRIAEASSEVSEYSNTAVEEARAGGRQLEQVKNSVTGIQDAVVKAGDQINLLKVHSQTIGQMVDLIQSISAETNLLALNAAIEAARAGEHGRGFAVVAGEVRKLAEQSNASADKITELVQHVTADTEKSVQLMKTGLSEVSAGMKAVVGAGNAFERIIRSSVDVADRIQEVAASAEQMSASSEEVSATLADMNNLAHTATGHARAIATSSDGQLTSIQAIAGSAGTLSQTAEELSELASRFKL
jgi:methyl-accepting chemotaxis protein